MYEICILHKNGFYLAGPIRRDAKKKYTVRVEYRANTAGAPFNERSLAFLESRIHGNLLEHEDTPRSVVGPFEDLLE